MASPIKLVKLLPRCCYYTSTRSFIRLPLSIIPRPLRQRTPEELEDTDSYKNFEERTKELIYRDPDIMEPVNIGVPFTPKVASKLEMIKSNREKRKNPEFEKLARSRQLKVDVAAVQDANNEYLGPVNAVVLAEHYGIYKDLFERAFFTPVLNMYISYDYDEDHVTPVCAGNKIPPEEASTVPSVEYEADPDSLWTLILTNPDGHLTQQSSEYLHWFVGNIPGNDVTQGEVLCDYLQPFPARGTGFQRLVYIMYKQDRRIDYSAEKRPDNCTSLRERTFNSFDFLTQHQDHLTPHGLRFFQCEWDASVPDIYHNVLNMREPHFEYKHPVNYVPRQERYPVKQREMGDNEPVVGFDVYLDRYRDKKEIHEEVLREKMKMISPYKPHPPRPKYPLLDLPPKNAVFNFTPTWQRHKMELKLRRLKQWKDLP